MKTNSLFKGSILNTFFTIIKLIFFRKKTLTLILWILIISIISELHAISNSEDLNALIDYIISNNESKFYLFIGTVIKFIIGDGSYLTLAVLTGILIVICFLKYQEIINNLKTKKVDKQIIYNLIILINQSKIIDEKLYTSSIEIIKNKKILKNLDYYYSFERKKGNIYLLEEFVRKSELINDLKLIAKNEI